MSTPGGERALLAGDRDAVCGRAVGFAGIHGAAEADGDLGEEMLPRDRADARHGHERGDEGRRRLVGEPVGRRRRRRARDCGHGHVHRPRGTRRAARHDLGPGIAEDGGRVRPEIHDRCSPRLAPKMVTDVPPVAGPDAGLTLVTVGRSPEPGPEPPPWLTIRVYVAVAESPAVSAAITLRLGRTARGRRAGDGQRRRIAGIRGELEAGGDGSRRDRPAHRLGAGAPPAEIVRLYAAPTTPAGIEPGVKTMAGLTVRV